MDNVRFAWRGLLKNPSFTIVAAFSLALGIGASTALFSVIYGVLISPYPYKDPHLIWSPSVEGLKSGGRSAYLPDEYQQLASLSSFSEIMATSTERMLLMTDSGPESLRGIRLTGNAFQFLDVPPALGRVLQPTDILPDGEAAQVTVISFKM